MYMCVMLCGCGYYNDYIFLWLIKVIGLYDIVLKVFAVECVYRYFCIGMIFN